MGSLKTNRKFSNSKSTTSSNKQGKLQSNKSSESNIRLTGTSSTVQSQRSLSSGISTSIFKKKKRIAHSSVYDPVVPNSTVAANSFDSSQINFQKNHSSMIHHLHQEFISSK